MLGGSWSPAWAQFFPLSFYYFQQSKVFSYSHSFIHSIHSTLINRLLCAKHSAP